MLSGIFYEEKKEYINVDNSQALINLEMLKNHFDSDVVVEKIRSILSQKHVVAETILKMSAQKFVPWFISLFLTIGFLIYLNNSVRIASFSWISYVTNQAYKDKMFNTTEYHLMDSCIEESKEAYFLQIQEKNIKNSCNLTFLYEKFQTINVLLKEHIFNKEFTKKIVFKLLTFCIQFLLISSLFLLFFIHDNSISKNYLDAKENIFKKIYHILYESGEYKGPLWLTFTFRTFISYIKKSVKISKESKKFKKNKKNKK